MTTWYKDAIIYEVRVRSFYDSDGDGIGDFRGLTEKLDYLKDLGVTALWLLPFYPSPLRDDGYDISDYASVHPDQGTLADFKRFLTEAHKRDLKVITELVLNHTSDQHPWFVRARRAPAGHPHRDFYVWSDDVSKYADARIIFKDFEHSNWTWDPVAKSHYWHRFYSHQPDLNFENPEVHKAVIEALDFWLDMGVDGLRLDAVPYLYEREGTNCENLPETHAFLRQLRTHVDSKYQDRMLLAEANQWPDDAVAYFGTGNECHMAFHFPIMPRMFMAIHMEDRLPLVDILAQTPQIPDNSQWAIFLRNHDELTLEMVTDEERDYMYKVYATDPTARINLGIRRRLAPLLGNHRRKIELMNGLLLALPGTPVIYYGDEIGMGDNIFLGDRNGVRTPMQWSSDKNAGFSRCNPQRMMLPIIIDPEYHYEAVNVEAQTENPHSLLRWMKRLISIRKQYKAMGRGSIEFLTPRNPRVLVFVRQLGDETVLVVANLSRFVQYVELDLSRHKGLRPVEIFGRVEFPAIGELPYFITLAPHAFYWFSLEKERRALSHMDSVGELPVLAGRGGWETLLDSRTEIDRLLPAFLRARPWFDGRFHGIQSAKVSEVIRLPGEPQAYFTHVRVDYNDARPDEYLLTLSCLEEEAAAEFVKGSPSCVLARVTNAFPDGQNGVLIDAATHPAVARQIFGVVSSGMSLNGIKGNVTSEVLTPFTSPATGALPPTTLISTEMRNTVVAFGQSHVMKIFRRLESGVNSDFEISRFLNERVHFPHTPTLAGGLTYRSGRLDHVTLGLVYEFVPNNGDAWTMAVDALKAYLAGHGVAEPGPGSLIDLAERRPPTPAVGGFLDSVRLLGRRTAELHRALSSEVDDPMFRPEPFSPFSQRAIYQSLRALNQKVFGTLRQRLPSLPEERRAQAEEILMLEEAVHEKFMAMRTVGVRASQIRCHGDYHLRQVLWTGKDFTIIDFEGESARALTERRLKRSPFKDVAGMIRSFHYAVYAALGDKPTPDAERRALGWYRSVAAAFLRSYFEASQGAVYMPAERAQREALLDTFLLEKAVYELGYELEHRPDWAYIPLKGIKALIEDGKSGGS